MSIDSLPNLNPPDFGRVLDAERPILSFSWQKAGAHRASAHRHERGHIIHMESGVYWAITPEGKWLVPPGQALWIPPNVHHEIYAQGSVSARMIFVDPFYAAPLHSRCGTTLVSPLLTELIQKACEYGNDYQLDSPAGRLARVMLDELAQLALAPLHLPISQDHRLARVMARLIKRPDAQIKLEEVAKDAGASHRTLARLFHQETGMTFSQWKTRLMLVESVERLSRGGSVTQVAVDLGYGSTSSFVYMFRSNMGISPGRYRPMDTTNTE
jgi:AraC-like DNA-binding protein